MADDSVFGYNPSIAPAAIFLLIFVVATLCHGFLLLRARAWYWTPFFIGGIFQIIGYLARIAGHNHEDSIPIYSIQNLFILLAPALYAASIYMVLGRLITSLRGQHLSIIRLNWMTKIFVAGDVLSFLAQCAGGGMMASGSSSTGTNITIFGLIIQILFFGFFLIASIIFHKRALRNRERSGNSSGLVPDPRSWDWSTLLKAIYVVSVLILVRSAFRLVEFIDGYGGYIMTHEAFLYIFDALLMSAAMVILVKYHPSFVLRQAGKDDWVPI
ncbi:RTA-like protein [Aspergillus germanicus]